MESSLVLARQSLSKYESDLRATAPRIAGEPKLASLVRAGQWKETQPLLGPLVERLGVDFIQTYELNEQGWILHNEAARRGISSPGAFPQELLRRALESDDAIRSEAGYVAVPVRVTAAGIVLPAAGPDEGASESRPAAEPTTGEQGDKLIVPGFWLGQDFFSNVREVTQGRLYYGQLEVYTRVVKRSVWVTAAILFAVMAGVSLAAAALLARQVSRPIVALTEGMKRVAAGHLDEKVTVRAGGEIGYLVESFNRMTEDLKFHKDQLARAERIAAWQDVARYAAHEIRNPLTPIKLSIHRLRSHLDGLAADERTRFSDSLESILNEVTALERLATSFSEFAKLPEPVLAPTDVNKIIKELAELHSGADTGGTTAGGRLPDAGGVKIVLSLSDLIPLAAADAQQLRMAFTNVIKNAMEAQPDGGVLDIKSALSRRSAGARAWRGAGGAIGGPGAVLPGASGPSGVAAGRPEPANVQSPLRVTLTSVPPEREDDDFIEVTFQDKGSGISESDMSKVGTPHFTTKKRGTGLGLAMVSKIISQHGGELSIESRVTGGTLVRILLPVQGTVN